ncbi:MAG: hypothetical protein PVJ57_17590 [Phycisphaerae bacterium]
MSTTDIRTNLGATRRYPANRRTPVMTRRCTKRHETKPGRMARWLATCRSVWPELIWERNDTLGGIAGQRPDDDMSSVVIFPTDYGLGAVLMIDMNEQELKIVSSPHASYEAAVRALRGAVLKAIPALQALTRTGGR